MFLKALRIILFQMNFKINIVLVFLFLSTYYSFSQKKTSVSKGIAFVESNNFDKIFEIAKAQNKKVFIEIYAEGCQHCEAYIPTFNNPKVGDYYNKSFVSCKLNIVDTNQAKFLNKRKIWIPSTPTMAFFDANQNLIHIVPAGDEQNTLEGAINFASTALDEAQNSASYKKRYVANQKDQAFLYNYGFYSRIIKDTLTNQQIMNEYAKNEPEDKYPSKLNFTIIQKIIMDETNPMVQYMANHLSDFYKNNDPKEVNSTLENIMMYAYYGSKGRSFSKEKRNEIKTNLRKIGIKEKDISARFIYYDVIDYLDKNQEEDALEAIKLHYGDKSIPEKEQELWLKEFTKRNKTSTTIDKLMSILKK